MKLLFLAVVLCVFASVACRRSERRKNCLHVPHALKELCQAIIKRDTVPNGRQSYQIRIRTVKNGVERTVQKTFGASGEPSVKETVQETDSPSGYSYEVFYKVSNKNDNAAGDANEELPLEIPKFATHEQPVIIALPSRSRINDIGDREMNDYMALQAEKKAAHDRWIPLRGKSPAGIQSWVIQLKPEAGFRSPGLGNTAETAKQSFDEIPKLVYHELDGGPGSIPPEEIEF